MNAWEMTRFIKPASKQAFIKSLRKDALLLDVGCGNNSPNLICGMRPDIYYHGIDIEGSGSDARCYYVSPERFYVPMLAARNIFDAVLCSHTIEHCLSPINVLCAMAHTLKLNGRMYLSTPCMESLGFPSRRGCLNYHDDKTHRPFLPLQIIKDQLEACGMRVEFEDRTYRPRLLSTIGGVLEPLSRMMNKTIPLATWAYWGFESVLILRKVDV